MNDYIKQNKSKEEASILARQGFVSAIGRVLEKIVELLLKDFDNIKILAILSVKNSFRERFTETPYWKLKLLQSPITSHIKVFMITPDNDDEISFKDKPKKARIVMEHELDGLYLAKSHFDQSSKIKGIENLLEDLKRLL